MVRKSARRCVFFFFYSSSLLGSTENILPTIFIAEHDLLLAYIHLSTPIEPNAIHYSRKSSQRLTRKLFSISVGYNILFRLNEIRMDFVFANLELNSIQANMITAAMI